MAESILSAVHFSVFRLQSSFYSNITVFYHDCHTKTTLGTNNGGSTGVASTNRVCGPNVCMLNWFRFSKRELTQKARNVNEEKRRNKNHRYGTNLKEPQNHTF